MKTGTWRAKVVRIYIDTKKVSKNGKPIRKPVTQRTLYIDTAAVVDSGKYRIFACNRGGHTSYTLAIVPRLPQNIYHNPSGRPGVWYKLPDRLENGEYPYERDDETRRRHPGKNEQELREWLAKYLGEQQARIACEAFLNGQPESEAA